MTTYKPFRFGVIMPRFASRQELQDFARRVEGDGWATLLTPDHLGLVSSFAPLVSAADVTTTLRFGTLVINNDFHRPVRLAQEAATVDLLTDGRLELGLGSGWSKQEYEILGIDYDKPVVRAQRLVESYQIMKKAWMGEPTVNFGGGPLPCSPAPAQRPRPTVLVGGHGDTILRFAAEEADIVGFTGSTWTGTALKQTGSSQPAIAERVDFVRRAAGERFDQLELTVAVGTVTIGGDIEERLVEVAAAHSTTPDVIRDSPLYLIGSESQVVDKLMRLREEIGLSYITVVSPALEAMTPIVAELAGH